MNEAARADAEPLPRPALRWRVARVAAYPALLTALAIAIVTGVAVGPVGIAPLDVLRVLARHLLPGDIAAPSLADTIVWDVRLPRVLLAGLVGGTLAYSGAAYQGVFRNPLADPYLLGVAAGAGLGATLVIISPLDASYGNVSLVTIAAFGGALAAVMLTYTLARAGGGTPILTLILAGVAVSSIATAMISYLMLVNDESTVSVLRWLLGGFNDSGWGRMWFILPYTIPAAAVIFLHGRLLNVLQLDDYQAQQLGLNVERTKLIVLVSASLAAASAVSIAGIIGFVGLIAPHAIRLTVGPDYRRLLPLSTLLGATFLIVADLGARTLVRPSELPLGVITSIAGAPLFLLLLRSHARGQR